MPADARRVPPSRPRRDPEARLCAQWVVYCEKCGCQVKPGGFEIDHRIPDAMFTSRADKKANATVDGGWLLCSGPGPDYCHRKKTAEDRTNISKADRLNLKHLGLYVKTGPKLKSRGFG